MFPKAIEIFFAAVAGDIFWALYIKKISQHRRLQGANYAALVGFCFLISLSIIINSFWYGIIYLIGLWVGTYWHQQLEDFFITLNDRRK